MQRQIIGPDSKKYTLYKCAPPIITVSFPRMDFGSELGKASYCGSYDAIRASDGDQRIVTLSEDCY